MHIVCVVFLNGGRQPRGTYNCFFDRLRASGLRRMFSRGGRAETIVMCVSRSSEKQQTVAAVCKFVAAGRNDDDQPSRYPGARQGARQKCRLRLNKIRGKEEGGEVIIIIINTINNTKKITTKIGRVTAAVSGIDHYTTSRGAGTAANAQVRWPVAYASSPDARFFYFIFTIVATMQLFTVIVQGYGRRRLYDSLVAFYYQHSRHTHYETVCENTQANRVFVNNNNDYQTNKNITEPPSQTRVLFQLLSF